MARFVIACLLVLTAALTALHVRVPATQAANAVQLENERPGTSSWQLTKPADGNTIEGYASATSVAVGGRLSFYVSTTAPTFGATVYRMGWYAGLGARQVLRLGQMRGYAGRATLVDPGAGLTVARWPVSFRLRIPDTWLTGIYMVKLTAATGYQSYIPFVVRSSAPTTFAFVHAVGTDEAYNYWGGKSLYGDVRQPTDEQYSHRAVKVSFDRPFAIEHGAGLFFFFEYPMVRWLERNGYDVSYITDLDVNEHYNLLLKHRAILIVGHDEYWSKSMRDNYEAVVKRGVSLGVFGGNTGVWAVRFERLYGRPDRIEVCYRDPKQDPLYGVRNDLVTVKWRDPPLRRPESALLGAMYVGITSHPFAWVASSGVSQLLARAGIAKGRSYPGLVGYEYDKVVSGSPVPSQLQILSQSPLVNIIIHRPDVSNSTLYTAPSGARVVNIGSIEWSWGLDNYSPQFGWFSTSYPRPAVATPPIQRLTADILALLGGQ